MLHNLKVKIERAITKATKVNIHSLNLFSPSQSQVRLEEAIMVPFEQGGRQIYLLFPFDLTASQVDWLAIIEYARQHPEAKLLLWLNGQIKEL